MQKEITAWASSDKSIVATLLDAVNNRYLYSKDGFNWSYRDFSVMANWTDVAWGNNTYIAINTDGVFVRSNDDGLSWTPFGSVVNSSLEMAQYVSYANDKFFISSRPYNSSLPRNKFFYSTNGVFWNTGFSPVGANFEKVYYANNRYITFLDSGTNIYLHSTNGTGWDTGILPLRGRWKNLTYDGTKFIATSDWSLLSITSSTGITSTDGLNWNTFLMPVNNSRIFSYNEFIKKYTTIANNSNLFLSDNGFNWTSTGSGLLTGTNSDMLLSFQDKFILNKYQSDYTVDNIRLFNLSTLPYNFPFKESGNLYSPPSNWSNGVGNAYIGNWFFVDRAGTFRGIINTNQNGRTSIGNSGFFFAPSTGTAAFYVDAYFNLINPLINGQGISLNANYSWNGGMRGIEFKPGTDGPSTFRIEHGNGDDRIYLRGPSFQDQVISTNGFQQALNYNIVYRQTGMLFEARNYTNNNLVFSTGLPISQTIRQIHFYIGNIQATQAQQLNYGLGVNNLETHYKQKVPFYSSSSSSFSSSSSSSSLFSSSSSSFGSSSSSRSSSSSSNSSSSSFSSSSSSNLILINNWKLSTSITGDFNQYLGCDLAINNSGNILFIGSANENKSVSIYTGSGNNWNLNKLITGFGFFSTDSVYRKESILNINDNGNILAVSDSSKQYINIYTGINNWNFKQSLTGPSGTITSFNMTKDGSTIVVGEKITEVPFTFGRIFIYTGNINNGWNLSQYIPGATNHFNYPDSTTHCIINSDGNILASWDLEPNSPNIFIYNFNTTLNKWEKVSTLYDNIDLNTFDSKKEININKDGTLLSVNAFSGNIPTINLYTGQKNQWILKQTITGVINNVFRNKIPLKYNNSGTAFIANAGFYNTPAMSIFSGSKNNGWSLIQQISGISLSGEFRNIEVIDANETFTTILNSKPDTPNYYGLLYIYTGKNLFL